MSSSTKKLRLSAQVSPNADGPTDFPCLVSTSLASSPWKPEDLHPPRSAQVEKLEQPKKVADALSHERKQEQQRRQQSYAISPEKLCAYFERYKNEQGWPESYVDLDSLHPSIPFTDYAYETDVVKLYLENNPIVDPARSNPYELAMEANDFVVAANLHPTPHLPFPTHSKPARSSWNPIKPSSSDSPQSSACNEMPSTSGWFPKKPGGTKRAHPPSKDRWEDDD